MLVELWPTALKAAFRFEEKVSLSITLDLPKPEDDNKPQERKLFLKPRLVIVPRTWVAPATLADEGEGVQLTLH